MYKGLEMATSEAFEAQLVALLPKMRVWAFALTRDRSAADDLTQDAAAKALAGSQGFTAGTNFGAWVYRIMRNHFISSVRNKRFYTDQVPEQPVPPSHIDKIAPMTWSWRWIYCFLYNAPRYWR